MMSKGNSKGFTLVEVMAAMVILVMAISMALSGYIFLLKNTNQADIQYELDVDVQLAIESLKKDLRLSSMDEIVYYPNSNSATAISFPIAYDSDDDGLIERNTNDNNKIIWDETIIYHIRKTTPYELIRTTLKPRDTSLNGGDLQAQLNQVVDEGHGGNAAEGSEVATSKIIFSNLLDWKLTPTAGQFSGFAPSDQPPRNMSLGYVLLNDDINTFTFEMTRAGKVGIDRFMATPCYHYMEAENLGDLNVTTKDPQPAYGNRSRLLFDGGVGDSFTLQIPNDRWQETDFDFISQGFLATERISIEVDYPNNDNIIKLEGDELAWDVSTQTGDYSPSTPSPIDAWEDTAVRTILKGANIAPGILECSGARCKLTFETPSATVSLEIENVYFGESNDPNSLNFIYNSAAFDPSSTSTNAVKFNGGSASVAFADTITSDWIDVPVDTAKNYIVSYTIVGGAPKTWTVSPANPQSQVVKCYPTGTAGSLLSSLPSNPQNWALISDSDILPGYPKYVPDILGLASVTASYVEEGTYTSDIFDTMLANPSYGYMSWTSDNLSLLGFDVRTGNNPDLSDVSAFALIPQSAPGLSFMQIPSNGRYVQFKAFLKSDADHLVSPTLRDVTLDWQGEERVVNIRGLFNKGPDYGDFELSVNGNPLQAALSIDLEIYKETQAMNHQSRKISSKIKVEITPRNSGL